MANAYDYWQNLCKNYNVENEKFLPIWKWSAFSNPDDARNHMDQIHKVLTEALRGNRYGDSVCVLFLIHCALKMRLDLLWSDNINKYRNDCFQITWTHNLWKTLIEGAETTLGRNSFYEDRERPGHHLETRVKVEAGIPLRSFCKEDYSGIWVASKRIWNRIDLADSVVQRWALAEYENNQNTFPGGISGGLYFFQNALNLFRNVKECLDRGENSISDVLERKFYYFPKTASFSDFLIGNNTLNNLDYEARWSSLVKVKRILLLGKTIKLVVHYNVQNASDQDVQNIVLRSEYDGERRFFYENNGLLRIDQNGVGYFNDGSQSVDIVINRNLGGQEEHNLIDRLSEGPLFFQPLVNNGNVQKGYFENISNPGSRKVLQYPLVIALPDELAQNYSLEAFFKGDLMCGGISYRLFKIENDSEYCRSGLDKLSAIIKYDEPRQMLEAYINGRKIRRCSMGWPFTSDFTPIMYKNQDCWYEIPFHSPLTNVGVYKFKLANRVDAPEQEIVVFPKNFKYTFIYSVENRCYCDVKLFIGARPLAIRTLRIDNSTADAEAWKNITHKSIIECDIDIENNIVLTLRIPSPVEGCSWKTNSEKLPDLQRRNNRDIERIPLREVNSTYLHYEPSRSTRNELPEHVHWIVSLFDKDSDGNLVRVMMREDFNCISQRTNRDDSLYIELPKYLELFFSSTNSLDAEIHLDAHVLLPGEEGFATDSGRTKSLIVSRFDERTPPESTSFFYFGLFDPKNHASKKLNELPSEDELRKDLWIKVPAISLGDGRMVWDGIHRIRPLHNENDIGEDSLSSMQKILLSNSYTDVRWKLAVYFIQEKLTHDDLNLIDGYIEFCLEHEIPLCNLWLLQAVLECDKVACQVPNVEKLLKKSNSKFAFDSRLIRPDVVDKFSRTDALKILLSELVSPSNGLTEITDGTAFKSMHYGYLAVNRLGRNDCEWVGQFKDGMLEVYEREYNEFLGAYSSGEDDWKLLICFIVDVVALSSFSSDDDNRHFKNYQCAMYCLRLLESIDSFATAKLFRDVSQWKYKKQLQKYFKEGFNQIVETIADGFEYNAEDALNNRDLGLTISEAWSKGQSFALDMYWMKIVEQYCSQHQVVLDLIPPRPGDNFQSYHEKVETIVCETLEKQLGVGRVFSENFTLGFGQGFDACCERYGLEKRNLDIRLNKEIVSFFETTLEQDVVGKAHTMGYRTCCWEYAFSQGVKSVGLDAIKQDDILSKAPKCPKSCWSNIEEEMHLIDRISSFGRNVALAVKQCAERSKGKMNIDVSGIIEQMRYNPENDNAGVRYSLSDIRLNNLMSAADEVRLNWLLNIAQEICDRRSVSFYNESEKREKLSAVVTEAQSISFETEQDWENSLREWMEMKIIKTLDLRAKRFIKGACMAYRVNIEAVPDEIWKLPFEQVLGAVRNLR